MYAVDYWDNEYIQQESARAPGLARIGRLHVDEHTSQLLDRVPLYDTFVSASRLAWPHGRPLSGLLWLQLVNLWDLRGNVIPMRMATAEAMRTLSKQVTLASDSGETYSSFPSVRVFDEPVTQSQELRASGRAT